MHYIEASSTYTLNPSDKSVYLAGGITNCPDWQHTIVQLLSETDYTLLNPRRKNFPIDDPNAARGQIIWEYHALRAAKVILFWFPYETLCPIVLYELGGWSMTDKSLYVGVQPGYKRIEDVKIQTEMVRPDVEVVYSLEILAEQVRSHQWKKS